MNPRPTFALSADTRLLIAVLAKAEVGDLIPYEQLSSAIGKTVTGAFPALQTVKRRMLRDHDMVFGVVWGKGLKRLSNSEIVSSGSADVEYIRRRANRSVERQMKADFDTLTAPEKTQFTAQVSVMASIAMMSKPKSLERIAGMAGEKAMKELPISATLKMFAESK